MKENKNLITNKSGNAHIIILAIFTVIMGFGMLTIGSYLYFAIATSADAGTIIVDRGATASGTFTFNGTNVSDSRTAGLYPVNATITNGGAVYQFEFNTTTVGNPRCFVANCILVNLSNTNTSLGAAINLTAAINANSSLATIVSASRTGNVTTVTYLSRGTAGNDIVLSDDSPASQSALLVSLGLSGGVNDLTGQTSQNNINSYVVITFPLFGLALMILGFSVIIITMKKSFGSGGVR